jgi:hypothetical protein
MLEAPPAHRLISSWKHPQPTSSFHLGKTLSLDTRSLQDYPSTGLKQKAGRSSVRGPSHHSLPLRLLIGRPVRPAFSLMRQAVSVIGLDKVGAPGSGTCGLANLRGQALTPGFWALTTTVGRSSIPLLAGWNCLVPVSNRQAPSEATEGVRRSRVRKTLPAGCCSLAVGVGTGCTMPDCRLNLRITHRRPLACPPHDMPIRNSTQVARTEFGHTDKRTGFRHGSHSSRSAQPIRCCHTGGHRETSQKQQAAESRSPVPHLDDVPGRGTSSQRQGEQS